MEYKKYLGEAYNIYTINTDKFKTCQIEMIFRNNLRKNTITKRVFLSYILAESTKKYINHKKLKEHFEDLYNLCFYVQNNKIGKTIHTSFKADFINPKYADKDLLIEVINLFKEVILNPNVINNAFDKTSFDIIKYEMIDEIKSEKESPMRHAIISLIENIDPDSMANIKLDGYIEDLELITPEELYEYYQEFIENDLCDIFIIGSLDMDYVNTKFREIFNLSTIKNNKLDYYEELKVSKRIKKVTEKTQLKQSKLVVGCNLVDLSDYEKNIVMYLLNIILGGGGLESILYKYLRQKNALCYNCGSIYQKNNCLLIINTSIDAKNYNLTVKLIKKALNDLKSGNITKEQLYNSKEIIMESLDMNADVPNSLLANYIFNVYLDMPLINERKKEYQKITIKDIVSAAKKIKINTIFLLENGGSNEKDNSK